MQRGFPKPSLKGFPGHVITTWFPEAVSNAPPGHVLSCDLFMYVVYPKLSLEVTSRARLKNLDSPKRTLRGASRARLQCDLFLMDVDIRSGPEGTSKARSIAVFSPSCLMGPPGHVLTMWLHNLSNTNPKRIPWDIPRHIVNG
jgi:hypothetical protein